MHLTAFNRPAFLFLIIVLSFGVYLSTLSNDFVWDDKYEILQNDWIKDVKYLPEIFSSHSLGWLRPEQSSTKYAPLKLLLRVIQYHLSGTDPWAYQLTNVLLHVASSLMVFFVAARLFSDFYDEKSDLLPFVASLLFALHPVHTEPVNWTIGSGELMMSFFCLVSFHLFMKSRSRQNLTAHIVPALFFFLAVLNKVTAAFFIFVFVAYDYGMAKRGAAAPSVRNLPLKLLLARYLPPAFSLIAYFSLVALVTAGESDPVKAEHIRLDHYNLMLNVPLLFFQYLEKLVLPISLNALYVFHPVTSFTEARFLMPLGLLVIYVFFMALSLRKDIMLFLCLLWTISLLLPCLYLPATGYSFYVFAERYLYLPSAGYVILLSALTRNAVKKRLFHEKTLHILAVLLVITGAGFSALTIQRNYVWKDDYSLWTDTALKSPDSDVAHNNLGAAYESRGLLEDALREYETALSLNPAYMDAYANRFRIMRLK